MQNINVRRYDHAGAGWQGWIEPEDKSWIMFVHDDGTPWISLNRDPETGECRAPENTPA